MLRTLAGGSLVGEVWGEGPPTVLALHGWRRTHTDFARALGPASTGGSLAVLAPDLPGFGSTPPPPEPWGSEHYAAACAELLEADAPSPVIVVGHSFGGRVAVMLAANRPELVEALVLSGVPLLPRPGRRPVSLRYRALRSLRRAGLIDEERLERARQRHGSSDYRAAQGVMRDVLVRLLAERYDEQLDRVQCPVELVWGADDSEAPVSVARAVARRLPQATLTVCPGVGHLVPVVAPDELRAAVVRAQRSTAGR